MSFKERIELWKKVLEDPKGTFAKTLKKGTLEDGVIHTILSSGISALLFGIALAALLLLSPSFSGGFASSMGLPSMSGIMGTAMLMVLLFDLGYMLIYFTIIDSVSLLIGSGIVYLLAKNMGGTGTYGKQTFVLALVQAPLRIGIYIFSGLLLAGSLLIKTSTAGWVLVGIGGLGTLALAIVTIIYQIWAMKLVHKVRTSTAALALLLPTIVLLILVGIIAVFILMAYSSVGGTGISPQSLLI